MGHQQLESSRRRKCCLSYRRRQAVVQSRAGRRTMRHECDESLREASGQTRTDAQTRRRLYVSLISRAPSVSFPPPSPPPPPPPLALGRAFLLSRSDLPRSPAASSPPPRAVPTNESEPLSLCARRGGGTSKPSSSRSGL